MAALVLVVLALVVPARAASAADSPTTTASPVSLLAQTPWVETKGTFQLRVSITGVQAGDQVVVSVYDQVITRSNFERDATGDVSSYALYQQTAGLSALTPDPAGGFDIDLPIDSTPLAGAPFDTVSISESSGVFPVQVQLLGALGGAKGNPLTTFLTYSQGTAKAQGYTPLSAAVIVPYSSAPVVGSRGQLDPPGPTEATRLDQLADALNSDDSVHMSVLASPATLAALQVGAQHSVVDRDAIDNIGGAPAGGLMQVLPTTWSGVSLGDLAQAGLSSETGPQLEMASQTLGSALGAGPSGTTWVVDGPLDQATFQAMEARGATQLIVPDSDLTALSAEVTTTFAYGTQLGSGPMTVYAADEGLAADFTRSDPPVLAANILLADLAMIYTESPGYVRGVVAMPPPGTTVDPTLIATLLSGLTGDPLVTPVTASGLFSPASTTRATRYLADPYPAPSGGALALAGDRSNIIGARTSLNELASVLPSQSNQLSSLETQLLLAESEAIGAAQRSAVLAAIARSTNVVAHAALLPPSTSITLTSTQGQIPITILAANGLHPRVELKLKSQRLIFLPFRPPGGSCTVPTPTVETCVLSLKTQNTTLKVPVETRSSGVFPLEVSLTPPGSSTVLSSDQDTVRSTAVSTVAIVLIVVALLGLAFWWVRDVRRGRRPQGMLPSPAGDPALDTDPGQTELDEFFRRPPPAYGGEPKSPSGTAAGPTAATERHGSGRETRE